jgi:hypothetical protein
MEYEVYLRREVLEFLRQRRPDERDQLLTLLRGLGRDPYRQGDFTERDRSGRNIEVLVFRRFAILYWADHAVKEMKVTDVRFADR